MEKHVRNCWTNSPKVYKYFYQECKKCKTKKHHFLGFWTPRGAGGIHTCIDKGTAIPTIMRVKPLNI